MKSFLAFSWKKFFWLVVLFFPVYFLIGAPLYFTFGFISVFLGEMVKNYGGLFFVLQFIIPLILVAILSYLFSCLIVWFGEKHPDNKVFAVIRMVFVVLLSVLFIFFLFFMIRTVIFQSDCKTGECNIETQCSKQSDCVVSCGCQCVSRNSKCSFWTKFGSCLGGGIPCTCHTNKCQYYLPLIRGE